MLRHVPRITSPTTGDLHQYLLAQDVARELKQHDVIELWKSAPYLLNFLDGYKLRSRFDAACKSPDLAPGLAALLNATKAELLDREQLLAYGDVDPGGPRMRELAKDVIDSEAWRLLWIPPSMPYYELGGRVRPAGAERLYEAARLLRMATPCPRAAAGLLSYLAERRLTLEADPTRAEHARAPIKPAQPARLHYRS